MCRMTTLDLNHIWPVWFFFFLRQIGFGSSISPHEKKNSIWQMRLNVEDCIGGAQPERSACISLFLRTSAAWTSYERGRGDGLNILFMVFTGWVMVDWLCQARIHCSHFSLKLGMDQSNKKSKQPGKNWDQSRAKVDVYSIGRISSQFSWPNHLVQNQWPVERPMWLFASLHTLVPT